MAILRSLRKLAQKTTVTTAIISNPTSFRPLISSNSPPLFSNPNNTLHGPLFLSYPPWKLLQSATPLYSQSDVVSLPNPHLFIKETKLPTVNLGLGLSEVSSVKKKKKKKKEDFESVGTRGLVDSFVNWPNFISMTRLVSGPVLGWMIMHDMYVPAFVGLAVSGATDWLDGYVARKMGINSVVGSYLDPLADKVLIGCVAMAMVERGLLHSGLVALVVLRDIALVGGAVYVRASHLGSESRSWQKFFNLDGIRPQKVEPLMISKVNTCLQLALVTFALLQPDFGTEETQSYITYLSWLVALTTVGSTAAYDEFFRHQIYDVYPGFTDKADVGCVSVESIRPCPPFLEVSRSWVCGDAVEVFHDLSWKLATVLKDCGCDQFLVRLVGSLQEFDVSGSEIRVSQKYQNGEWVEVDVTIPRVFKAAGCTKMLLKCDQDSCLAAKQGSNKPLKRALSCCDSEDEEGERRPQKFREFEKEGKRLRLLETSPEQERVVALALEINDTHSVMSSSGSCNSNSYKPDEVYSESGPVEDYEVYESDAESVCQLEDRIHGLELKAYRCAMEKLYESGTLTWEEDARITSLRMLLNISENEHLIILKCLIYASRRSIRR